MLITPQRLNANRCSAGTIPRQYLKKKIQNSGVHEKKHGVRVLGSEKKILLISCYKENATRYCETLKILRRAIQNIKRGILTKEYWFLHDNARPTRHGSLTDLFKSSLDGTFLITRLTVLTRHQVVFTYFPN